ncbi:MAG: (R)-specific enoyl-CoA hydratase [Pelotomaculum sp. PtaB.Bin104]|nr:MAG: (R)-specific enoyl-CoA hydratase [Pelotomaculum sp. PtaB.Bin104]
MVHDYPFGEIEVGDRARYSKRVTEADIFAFAEVTGDFNPLHIDQDAAAAGFFKQRVAHGLFTASLISTVLGTTLPGAGTIYLSKEINFKAPAFIGDTLTVEVEVLEKKENKHILVMGTRVINQSGRLLIDGRATVMKP